ncbi:YopX family protein [Lacticaseibacillus paracasei]|uniref:YopX family protein n=1 Tax=Lacticaseibacillus paracasei TaxID=1597 RepID=UPI00202F898C|nr:YopX family protein [Lacticaseibacillus paracasei]URW90446.1 YopX family protein [Lacticaseibacillus paracasei]
MKREIRFRAWDDLHNKMYPVSDIEWDADGRMWVTTDDGKNGIELIDEEAHLMQYAGLEDKNGREIYENDILKVISEDGESYVATVKWFGDEGYPAFDLAGIPAAWCYESNALATIFESGVETCEVIGNIFENPELLEGKQ